LKWIYFARRAAGVAVEDFPKRWRAHARLAARFPDLAGYFSATIYCLVSGNGAGRFDAAGLLTVESEASIRAILTDPDAVETMHPDELRVFEDHIARLSLAADEVLVVEGTAGPHARLLLVDAAGAPAHEIQKAVLDVVGTLSAGPARCVVNHVREGVFPSVHAWSDVIEVYGEPELCAAAGEALASALRGWGAVTQVEGRVIVNWRADAQA
jgi:hypothetical protein